MKKPTSRLHMSDRDMLAANQVKLATTTFVHLKIQQ